MEPININIDSTALATSSCLLNFKRTVIDGYRTVPSSSLIYGVAVHKFIDVMYKTSGHFPSARDEARRMFSVTKLNPGKGKDWQADEKHLISTCYNVWTEYVEKEASFEILQIPVECWWCKGQGSLMGEDQGVLINHSCTHCQGKGIIQGPATELTFKTLFYEDSVCRIHLCGTIDSLGQFKGGCYAIRDWKTTSAWDGSEYLSQYQLSRQLRMYNLAARLEARAHPDSPLGKVGATKVGAFIDAIFLKPKANENAYERTDVYQYSDKEMTEFEDMVQDFCIRFSHAIEHNTFNKEGIINGSCILPYPIKEMNNTGKCKFWNVCKSNETVGELLLKRDFQQKPFDPLAYNED